MKLITLTAAALLLAAPVKAQEIPPLLFMSYAQLGAVTLGSNYMEKGDYFKACIVYQHLRKMEAETNETIESRNLTTRLINRSCGADY